MKRISKTILLALINTLLHISVAHAQINLQVDLRNVLLSNDGKSVTFELWATALPSYLGANAAWDTLYYRADASVGTYNIAGVDILPTSAVNANATAYITNPGPPPVGSSKFGLTLVRPVSKPDLIIETPVELASVTLHFNIPVKSGSANIVSRSPPTYTAAQSTYYTNGSGREYFVSSLIAGVLPIGIISFTGIKNAGGNLLSWITTDPVNFGHFELQRSADGGNFSAIVKVLPNNGNSYNYTDGSATGTSLYRLVLVDLDGSLQYSKTIAITGNVSSFVIAAVYPIPATTVLNVALYAPANTVVTYTIADLNGAIITEEKHAAFSATTRSLNVANLVYGTYLLIIDGAGAKNTTKFIKL